LIGQCLYFRFNFINFKQNLDPYLMDLQAPHYLLLNRYKFYYKIHILPDILSQMKLILQLANIFHLFLNTKFILKYQMVLFILVHILY
jgi:hypothetical protein